MSKKERDALDLEDIARLKEAFETVADVAESMAKRGLRVTFCSEGGWTGFQVNVGVMREFKKKVEFKPSFEIKRRYEP